MIFTKARIKYEGWRAKPPTYFCRKDWHHENFNYVLSWYNKKEWRRFANQQVRKFEGEIPSGGWYKKIFDLRWTVL
jgi:hypothetical protein